MEAFRVAQKLGGQVFIEETKDRKRAESRNAYDFIDKQVKSYEQQLAQAENRLKEFLSENTDGTEQEANARMAQLRNQLELAELEKKKNLKPVRLRFRASSEVSGPRSRKAELRIPTESGSGSWKSAWIVCGCNTTIPTGYRDTPGTAGGTAQTTRSGGRTADRREFT